MLDMCGAVVKLFLSHFSIVHTELSPSASQYLAAEYARSAAELPVPAQWKPPGAAWSPPGLEVLTWGLWLHGSMQDGSGGPGAEPKGALVRSSHMAAIIYECDFGISGLPKYNLFQNVISNKRIHLFFHGPFILPPFTLKKVWSYVKIFSLRKKFERGQKQYVSWQKMWSTDP